MKNLNEWLLEYGESHQNPTNILLHKICVPVIFISLYTLLFSIDLDNKSMYYNWANLVYLFALIFWFRLNIKLGMAFLGIGFIFALVSFLIWMFCFYFSDRAMMRYSIIVFVLGWIGQFIGHKIEGKKPSFLKDLQFLLIGPIWVFYPKGK